VSSNIEGTAEGTSVDGTSVDGTSVDGSDSVSVSDMLVDTVTTGGIDSDSVLLDDGSFFEIDVGALHGSTGIDRAQEQRFPILVKKCRNKPVVRMLNFERVLDHSL